MKYYPCFLSLRQGFLFMKTEQLYEIFKKAGGISIDSRTLKPNDLFFALSGETDGHKYVRNAVEKGACMAVIDKDEYAIAGKTFLVKNTEKSLQELAVFHRKQLSIPILALTGSNGKTTTKELIAGVLSKKYGVTATRGNLNNHLGVPLTLLSIQSDTDIAVIEMGANHQGEIKFLCLIAQPTHGLITNYGKAHLEGFGGVEGVIKGKTEMYDFLKESNGTMFVNADDDKLMEKSAGGQRYTFSTQKRPANVYVELLQTEPFIGFKFEDVSCHAKLYGSYNFTNMAYAITIGKYFDVPTSDTLSAVCEYESSNNRSQIVEKATNKVILDAYNANPSSMEVALQDFKKNKHPYKILVLGDMFELGEDAAREHLHIAQLASKTGAHKIYLAGQNFSGIPIENAIFKKFETTQALIGELQENPIKNALILVKGSRGMAMEKVMEIL